MLSQMVAERELRLDDKITGLVAVDRMSRIVWSGEFAATYGDGKIGRFVANSDKDVIGFFYPVLEDGTVTVLTNVHLANPSL